MLDVVFARGRFAFAILLCSVGGLLGSGSSAWAGTTYTDSFNRGTIASPVNLPGSTPTFGGNTWSGGGPQFQTDGTKAFSQPGISQQVSAELPFTAMVGGISSYSLTMQPDLNSGDSWVGMGFTTSATDNGALFQFSAIWVLYSGIGSTAYFTTTGGTSPHLGGTASPVAGVLPPDTFTVTIDDTNTSFPTAHYSDTLGLLGATGSTLSILQSDVTDIQGVGLGRFDNTATDTSGGSYSNLLATTTSVPEPASIGLLAVTWLAAVRRRRIV